MSWDALAWTERDRVRKAREAAGFEIGELSASSSVTRHTISRWESGARAPQRSTVQAVVEPIAERLGVDRDELIVWIRTGESPAG